VSAICHLWTNTPDCRKSKRSRQNGVAGVFKINGREKMALRKLLYTPSGKAGEYANKAYAANIFNGCTHGCKYCYVPSFLKMGSDKKETFERIVSPVPDLYARLGEIDEPIFLCFTCDPYPEDLMVSSYTRDVIAMILDSGNSVNILTKAGTRAVRDFDMLCMDKKNRIGATLTFIDPFLSSTWEPRAASPVNRVEMLRQAKERGIHTWASVEPVIVPSESLKIIELASPYVDEFKVGKWNYDKRSNAIDWHGFVYDVVSLLEKIGKKYTIKEDLKKYI